MVTNPSLLIIEPTVSASRSGPFCGLPFPRYEAADGPCYQPCSAWVSFPLAPRLAGTPLPFSLYVSSGVFSAPPRSVMSRSRLVVSGRPRRRGTAVIVHAVAVVGRPNLGPVVGSALVVNPHLGWRWTEYTEAISTFTIFGLCLFALPER